MPKKKIQRILLKISGESLMGTNEYGIDLKVVTRLAKELIEFNQLLQESNRKLLKENM